MAVPIPFTDNYQDLSTDKGFQFKFNCERCGNGYMSTFQYNITGMAGDFMRAASNFLGDVFGKAADSAYDIQRAVGGPAHDKALRAAVEEISPLFRQCGRCGQWVCTQVCFNTERNQCAQCSPKMEHEIKAIESEGTIYQLRQQAMYEKDMKGGVELKSAAESVQCPTCKATVEPGQKFCGECGGPMAQAKPKCPQCGTEAAPGKKFCGECGAKL
jgi:hypothetical protein